MGFLLTNFAIEIALGGNFLSTLHWAKSRELDNVFCRVAPALELILRILEYSPLITLCHGLVASQWSKFC